MQQNPCDVRWIDVAPEDLGVHTFESLSAKYRSSTVVALTTRLGLLDGVVINLLSPLGSVFCAPSLSSGFMRQGFGCGFEFSRDRQRLYASELRRASVRMASAQARLFGNFNDVYGKRARAVPSLSCEMPYLENSRILTRGFNSQDAAAVRIYVDRYFAQLGHQVCIEFPEGQRVNNFLPGRYSFDFWLMNWASPIFGLHHGDDCDAMGLRVLAELQRSVARLESGLPYDIVEDPICRIYRPARLHCQPSFARPLTAEVICYRSRLLRLLRWPSYFRRVEAQIVDLRETWDELSAGMPPLPYQPIEELEAYLTDMLELFPVLGEDPFAGDT